jgi:hypothetical protein
MSNRFVYGGLVLPDRAHGYYAKKRAPQAVIEATHLPIRGNEIEVA